MTVLNYYLPFFTEYVVADCDEQNCDYQNNDEVLSKTSEKPDEDCQTNESVDLNEPENRCKFYDIG